VSDTYSNLNQWLIPSGWVMGAGTQLLVWADGQTVQTSNGFLHAGFRLNSETGSLVLVWQIAGTNFVLDAVDYGPSDANTSIGVYPDGVSSGDQVFHYPTPGGPNNPASDPVAIYINEWMADNVSTLADEAENPPAFEDWFELYNAQSTPVDLTGFTLTDNLLAGGKYTIPPGTVVPPRGFLMVWADNDPEQNEWDTDLHTSFRLSNGGESLGIYLPDGTLLDAVTFGAQQADISEGRWADGSAALYPMAVPTPGASNVVLLITELEAEPGQAPLLKWVSRPGWQYVLECRDALSQGAWIALDTVTAVDVETMIQDTNSPLPVIRFYRLRELP